MSLTALLNDKALAFSDVIAFIDDNYHYTPCAFVNGVGDDNVHNEAGKNEGSCKVFAFAQLNQLSEAQTLHLFSQFYRDDVLKHLEGNDHANIRTFMKYGWEGIQFQGQALTAK